MLLFEPKYRMSDLVERTGFTERQIRSYIARRLVPGAEKKGPEATYDQATLDRLLLIRHLRTLRVAPQDRPLTSEEMVQVIESLGEERARQITSDTLKLTILDTESSQLQGDWLPNVRSSDSLVVGSASEADAPLAAKWLRSPADRGRAAAELGEMGDLLWSLLAAMEELTRVPSRRAPGRVQGWRRLAIEDLEIQFREPTGRKEAERLDRYAAALRTLLAPRA